MIEFRLPSLGADMDEGTLLQWRVAPGDAVKKGRIVCVVDTAKAAIDVECWHDGIVHALLVQPGARIPVGTPMAVLREAGETAEAVDAWLAQRRARSAAAAPAPAPAPEPAAPPVSAAGAGERRRISPAARKRAAELGVALDSVASGGAVAPAPAAAPAPPADRAAEMRRVIAAAMARAKREIPHYYLTEDIPLAEATGWLAQANAARAVTERLLLAPLLLRAVALALARYPEFNGYFRDGAFQPGPGIHLGVAISLRGGGLVTPALHDVDRTDLDTLNRALLDLTRRARAGSLRLAELTDATVTVTSLGEQGVAGVLGVIFPPQVAIVGFGRVTERPWIVDGQIRAAPLVSASLAADHRVSDGHRGGLFLAAVRDLLQTPEALARASA